MKSSCLIDLEDCSVWKRMFDNSTVIERLMQKKLLFVIWFHWIALTYNKVEFYDYDILI